MGNSHSIEDFSILRINTELLGRVITAKFNGHYEPKRARTLSVTTRNFGIEKLSFDDWKKQLHNQIYK